MHLLDLITSQIVKVAKTGISLLGGDRLVVWSIAHVPIESNILTQW